MKNGRTLMELAEELYRQNKAKKDYLIDTPALHMFHEDGKFQLGLGGQSKTPVPANLFDVNPLAHPRSEPPSASRPSFMTNCRLSTQICCSPMSTACSSENQRAG